MASTMKVSFGTNSGVRVKAIDKARLSILSLLGAWAFSFSANLLSIFSTYMESPYETHGFVALAAFGILYLSKYRVLTRTTIQSSQVGLFGLLSATVCWSLANIAGSQMLETICCFAMLPMIFFTTFGWQAFKKMYYALAFIFCSLPIGQIIGAKYSAAFFDILVKIISFTSDEVYWQNNIIEFKSENFDLTQITAVLHNMMLILTLTFFIINYLTDSLRKRIIIACATILAPVSVLLLTQFIIIRCGLINDYTQESFFTYFVLGTTLLLVLLLAIRKDPQRKKAFNMYSAGNDWQRTHSSRVLRWLKPTIVSSCILLALPFATHTLKTYILNYQGEILLALPARIGSWQEIDNTHDTTQNTLTKKYQKNKLLNLELRTKFFETAIINEQNNVENFLNTKWNLIKDHTIAKYISNQEIEIQERIYSDGNQYKLVWSFYDIHQHIFAKHSYAAIADNWYTLTKSARRSSLITLDTNCAGNIEGSRNQLHDFLTNFWPELPNISNPPRKLN